MCEIVISDIEILGLDNGCRISDILFPLRGFVIFRVLDKEKMCILKNVFSERERERERHVV